MRLWFLSGVWTYLSGNVNTNCWYPASLLDSSRPLKKIKLYMSLRNRIHLVWGKWHYPSVDLKNFMLHLLKNLGRILLNRPQRKGACFARKPFCHLFLLSPESSASRLMVTTHVGLCIRWSLKEIISWSSKETSKSCICAVRVCKEYLILKEIYWYLSESFGELLQMFPPPVGWVRISGGEGPAGMDPPWTKDNRKKATL